MTSHFGSKEEFIFFSFQTAKPWKKKTQAKTSEKQKKKKGPKIRLSHEAPQDLRVSAFGLTVTPGVGH